MPSDDLKRRLNPPLLTIGAAFLILTIVIAALALGRPFLLPLVLAIVVWYVIASLRDFMANIRLGGFQLPRWVSLLLSMLVSMLVPVPMPMPMHMPMPRSMPTSMPGPLGP